MANPRKPRFKPVALISTSAKTGEELYYVRDLRMLGWSILASGGTYAWLQQNNVACHNVSTFVGKPILGHRVVTLSRKIYAAILARDTMEDRMELRRIKTKPIKLVYVRLYDLEVALDDKKIGHDAVVEKIDIGGPTLLRAAAKAGRLVAASPHVLGRIIEVLKNPPDSNPFRNAKFEMGFRHQLYAEAERAVQEHSKLAESFYQKVADGEWDRWD